MQSRATTAASAIALAALENTVGAYADAIRIADAVERKCCGCGFGSVSHEVMPATVVLEAEV